MKRRGFTILEILLALALTAVVLGLLGLAVDTSLQVAVASRREVEQSQSVRFLLRQMADDLRATIPVARAPASLGCLRGNRRELQMDISRMPSLDETRTVRHGEQASPPSPPSDVRTVMYLMADPDGLGSPESDDPHPPMRGLVRGEWERASFAWAIEQGGADQANQAMKPLAPDVKTLEFTYYDGDGMEYSEWNSEEKGRLPAAVQIVVSMQPLQRVPTSPLDAEGIDPRPPTSYRVLVDLPNARATLDKTLAAIAGQVAPTSPKAKTSDQDSNSQETGIQEVKPLGSGGSSK